MPEPSAPPDPSAPPRCPFGAEQPSFAAEQPSADPPLRQVRIDGGAQALHAVLHGDVVRVLVDPGFSRDLRRPGDPRKFPGLDVTGGGATLTGMDAPEHTRLRRLLQPAVGRVRTERWRPQVRAAACALADALAARPQPADLVSGYTRVLPTGVMARILGVEEPDRERFQADTRAFLSVTAASARERVMAVRRLLAHVDTLIATARRRPEQQSDGGDGDGVLGVLLAQRDDHGDPLDGAELRNAVFGLLVGGYQTTAATLGRGMLALLRDPEAYRALVRDPALIPGAVEEILRYAPPDDGGMLRRAVRPVDLPSGTVAEGSVVLPSMRAANRDAAVFADPDRFDITRAPNPHLTFGAGPHYCLGAAVARMQLHEGIAALLDRFPTLRLADPAAPVHYEDGLMVDTLTDLPVTWN
ncbi:cytochrome P450 [Streptacidiphilus cavernicola]|uniref:Cytochrome P450 n=1 Tax=Streptacidiphilus cavernicola TaxID=3342716 RepID=A0ABV6VSJ7_9ACTN